MCCSVVPIFLICLRKIFLCVLLLCTISLRDALCDGVVESIKGYIEEIRQDPSSIIKAAKKKFPLMCLIASLAYDCSNYIKSQKNEDEEGENNVSTLMPRWMLSSMPSFAKMYIAYKTASLVDSEDFSDYLISLKIPKGLCEFTIAEKIFLQGMFFWFICYGSVPILSYCKANCREFATGFLDFFYTQGQSEKGSIVDVTKIFFLFLIGFLAYSQRSLDFNGIFKILLSNILSDEEHLKFVKGLKLKKRWRISDFEDACLEE